MRLPFLRQPLRRPFSRNRQTQGNILRHCCRKCTRPRPTPCPPARVPMRDAAEMGSSPRVGRHDRPQNRLDPVGGAVQNATVCGTLMDSSQRLPAGRFGGSTFRPVSSSSALARQTHLLPWHPTEGRSKPLHQIRNPDAQRIGEDLHGLNSNVALPAFDLPHVAPDAPSLFWPEAHLPSSNS